MSEWCTIREYLAIYQNNKLSERKVQRLIAMGKFSRKVTKEFRGEKKFIYLIELASEDEIHALDLIRKNAVATMENANNHPGWRWLIKYRCPILEKQLLANPGFKKDLLRYIKDEIGKSLQERADTALARVYVSDEVRSLLTRMAEQNSYTIGRALSECLSRYLRTREGWNSSQVALREFRRKK